MMQLLARNPFVRRKSSPSPSSKRASDDRREAWLRELEEAQLDNPRDQPELEAPGGYAHHRRPRAPLPQGLPTQGWLPDCDATFDYKDVAYSFCPPMREGHKVEYYSRQNDDWMPAVVSYVDSETGDIQIDLKPEVVFSLSKRRKYIRERVAPGLTELMWIRGVISEGRINTVADGIFEKGASGQQLKLEDLGAVGKHVDRLLGTSGHGALLKAEARRRECTSDAFTQSQFRGLFWDMLMTVHQTYGHALHREALRMQKAMVDPDKYYDLRYVVGGGSYGSVWLAVHRETGVRRAIKQMDKRSDVSSKEQHKRPLCTELTNLINVDHPHIVKVYDFFEDKHNHYIVMDLCSGGDLKSAIYDQNRLMEEPLVAHVLEHTLLAVSHLHCHGLVHKDLKPANIMLTSSLTKTIAPGVAANGKQADRMPHVMVIDLGLAEVFHPGYIAGKVVGTPMTMAPEVWEKIATPKSDVFSCGAILYEMLAACHAWKKLPSSETREALAFWRSSPSLDMRPLRFRSRAAVALVQNMSLLDRMDRLTVCECLRSSFIVDNSVKNEVTPAKKQEILARIAKASKRSLLHRSVALALASKWPSNQLPSLRKVFMSLDKHHEGRLRIEDIHQALVSYGLSEEEALECARSMDLDNDGFIGWTEFVAMCIRLSDDQLKADLQRVFKSADFDGDGYLSQAEIKQLFAAKHLQTEDIARQELDTLFGTSEEGAKVNWRQFRRYFDSRAVEELGDVQQESEDEGETEEEECAPKRYPSSLQVQYNPDEYVRKRDRKGSVRKVGSGRRSQRRH